MSVRQHGSAILRPAFARLDELAKLERDWDSYGALPLTSTALDHAAEILRNAAKRFGEHLSERVAPYTVMPIADGGVSLEWRGANSDLQLDVGPSGALSYLLIDRRESERRFEEGYDLTDREALELVRRVLGG